MSCDPARIALQKAIRRSPSFHHWEKIGLFSHVGIDLPLSALWSQKSCGIGEFYDLIPLIDWCHKMGFDVIQLLPLNDSGMDPSPYNALSSLALHPIYLSLHKLPYLKDSHLMHTIAKLCKLNGEKRIPFQRVLEEKMQFLSLYFVESRDQFLANPAFCSFCDKNPWLEPYALFKALRQHYKADFPDEIQYIDPKKLHELLDIHREKVFFYKVLQYLCFCQLVEVKKHAADRKVLLKGDIPILISPSSADVWMEKSLFDLNFCVGSPPDLYAPEGQNWGFPMFCREKMQKQNFSWWKRRLAYASNFYDLYRIDHVIGLFRIWAIPPGLTAKEGSFIPADESLWGPHGKELLFFFLENSSMLPIAEDLGAVPNMVRPILQELGIPGTKVMRWERNWLFDQSFIDPKAYEELSLTCLSTHDSPTLAQWWRDFPDEVSSYAAKKGWDYHPLLTLEQRKVFLKESITSSSLFHINLLSEYLALIPELVWEDPDDERINIPGTILPSNWTYKFRKSVEEICHHPLLQKEIKNLFKYCT
jgi:4-alpha-glucanotransferase